MTKNLFMYWTGPNFDLINILFDIVKRHSVSSFDLHLVNDENLNEYVPLLPNGFENLNPAYKADFIRVSCIKDHGGIYLDADTLILNNLNSIYCILNEKESVFFTENNKLICNGAFASRKNSQLMNLWFDFVFEKIESSGQIQWGELGNHFLTHTYLNHNKLFCNSLLLNGLETVYPVTWEDAKNVYCYSNLRYQFVKRGYQPFIILVNSVYKTWEDDINVRNNSLIRDLIDISTHKFM